MAYKYNPFTGTLDEVPLITAEVSFPLSFPLGTEALPGIYLGSDNNTGIYSPGADQISITTAGSERLRIDSSGNVEIGGNITLKADGKVGIKTSNPVQDLDVNGTIRFGAVNKFVSATNTLSSETDGGAHIRSALSVEAFPTYTVQGDVDTGVFFPAANNLAVTTGGSERLRIDSSGRVGIGTSSPDALLTISSSNSASVSNSRLRLIDTDTSAVVDQYLGRIEFFGSDTTGAGAGVKSAITAKAQTTGGDSYLTFSTSSGGANDIERLRIDSSGNVGIGTTLSTAVLTTAPTAAFSPTINNDLSGVGLLLQTSANVESDGYRGTAVAWARPGDSTRFKTAIAPVQEGTDKDRQALSFFTTSGGSASSAPAEVMRLTSTGNVSIGGTIPSAPNISLNADGSATFAGTVTANGTVLTSDQRFKENITPANPQLADIEALGAQLKNYDWNADAPSGNGTRQLGLIAQDAEAVCPGIVKTIARTKQGAELTPEVVVPAVYETRTVPAVLDDEGEVVKAETTEQVLVTEEQITPATYEELDDSYKGISHDALIMKLLGAVAELSAKVAALEAS